MYTVVFKLILWLVFAVFLIAVVAGDEHTVKNKSATCVLPPYPDNGRYDVAGYPWAKPGDLFEFANLNVSCNPGSKVIGNNVILCVQGEWSRIMPQCVPVCKLETYRSVKYTCKRPDSDSFEECGDSEPVGTVVQPQCREGYYSPSALPLMQCHEGVWDFVATCISECGIAPANAKTVPWFSYIYEELPMEYRGRCGGTIITNNVVVSAAHCFGSTRTHNALDYAVVVQPFSQTFAKKDLEAKGNLYTSIHRVRKIDIPVLYKGELTNYQYDIALLTLQTPVVFSAGVMPACLDFQQDFDKIQLTAGNVGTVPVWSSPVTENSTLSLHEYPFITTEACLDMAPPSFQEFITGDKFCAGLDNRTMIHRGNSGSGLTFPSTERLLTRHYLRGIVSIAPEWSVEHYATNDFVTFTRITSFEHFIKSNL